MKIRGKEIFLERVSGSGDLNFVLIHNAGGDHHFFTHQIEMLGQFGDVIQIDLPGHGKSEVTASYKIADLSALIVEMCTQLSLKNVCLIGLNNGANIAIEMFLRSSMEINGLILLDPPIFMNEAFVREIREFIQVLEKPESFDQFLLSLADHLFVDTDLKNKKRAIEAFSTVNKQALQAVFSGLIEWDAHLNKGQLKNVTCPTLCILSDEHHCTYEKMRTEAPQFELGKVVGAKCWAALEVPEQINSMIARFLKIILHRPLLQGTSPPNTINRPE